MEVEGKLIICKRCRDAIFLQKIGQTDLDGGYTRYAKYENLPDSWMYNTQIGYTCPTCSELFRNFIFDTFGSNVAPSWKKPDPSEEQTIYNRKYVYISEDLL